MNDVLRAILETRQLEVPGSDERIALHSEMTEEEGRFLQEMIGLADAKVTLEVGMAFGISGLFICEATREKPGARHVAIDPFQLGNTWRGIGINNLRRAGFGERVTLVEKPSHQALPELEQSGLRLDFALIDGFHTFDHTLIDFFGIDRMLREGGILAIDDCHMPAVRKACRFILSNRSYSIVGSVGTEWTQSRGTLGQMASRTKYRAMVRPDLLQTDAELGLNVSSIALRKDRDDDRAWDHYLDF